MTFTRDDFFSFSSLSFWVAWLSSCQPEKLWYLFPFTVTVLVWESEWYNWSHIMHKISVCPRLGIKEFPWHRGPLLNILLQCFSNCTLRRDISFKVSTIVEHFFPDSNFSDIFLFENEKLLWLISTGQTTCVLLKSPENLPGRITKTFHLDRGTHQTRIPLAILNFASFSRQTPSNSDDFFQKENPPRHILTPPRFRRRLLCVR